MKRMVIMIIMKGNINERNEIMKGGSNERIEIYERQD